MKKIALAAAAASLMFVSTASAADMAPRYTKAPPPVVAPVATWTGCYIGINGGWARSETDASWVANPIGFGPGAAAAFATVGAATHTADGGTVGGQAGCNWQQQQWVLGFEVDGNWADLHTHRDAVFTPALGGGAATLTEDYRVRAFGTIRGRLGLAAGANWLLYVTGGGAWANFRYSDCETAGATLATCSTLPGAGTGYNAAYVSDTRFGWVAGAGVETKFSPNWSVKAEYLYMGFGNHSVNAPFVNFPGFAFTNADITFQHRNQNIQTARIGVNYHFGGPVVAKY
jgi:outer membrane immunogenic protein